MSVPVRRWYCQKEPVAMRVCSAVYNESRQTRREHYRGGRRLRTGKNKTNARCQGRRVALTVAENGLMNWTHFPSKKKAANCSGRYSSDANLCEECDNAASGVPLRFGQISRSRAICVYLSAHSEINPPADRVYKSRRLSNPGSVFEDF